MASSRKKQDEKNLKILRELGSQASNRTCFDCHQRGTTYINMTVGSFVCTSCSGILRGLNPPHRVKSISMASFTQEEIEQIKSKGNQYCGAVWLGLYDAKLNPFPDTKDEHKIRDFMILKYEKKRFFIDPTVALKNMPPQNSSATSSNASTPSSETSKAGPVANSSVSRPNVSSSQSSGSVSGALTSATNTGSKNSTPKSSASLDLLADLSSQPNCKVNSNDPFASPTSSQAPTSVSQPSFANFENANIFTNTSEDQPSKTEHGSTCHTLTDQSRTMAITPLSLPPTRSPSPRISPGRITNWEAFEGEEANAGTPLIPIAESFPPNTICYDTSGRATNKGKNIPSMKFASGVSAQFVYPTNSKFEACPKEESKVSSMTAKQSSNSSAVRCESNWHSSTEPQSGLRYSSPKVAKNVQVSQLQMENSHSHSSPFHSQKLPHNSKGQDNFTYSALNVDSSRSGTVTPILGSNDVCEKPEKSNFFHLNTKSNEISSKYFDAFLSSSKVSRVSFQDNDSESGQVTSESGKKEVKQNSLGNECGSENLGMVGNLTGPVIADDKTNPFISDRASVSTDENTIFDNVPLFPKKKIEATKPVSINSSNSSSCQTVCPPCALSGTNPFVSTLQPDANAHQGLLSASSATECVGSFSGYSHSAMSLHESLSEQLQPLPHFFDNSMTSTNYILAGSTSSSKPTPVGPHLPFSSNPLTPLAPGSSSNPSSSSASSLNNTQPASSNNPAQDRYAALKDLDEEFKTHKESETVPSNGGGSWPVPNGSHQNSSAVFGSSSSTVNGTVFDSSGTSSSVFGTVNGGSSGGISGGAFGTPPNTTNAWANFSGANPFSGCNSGAAAAWINGGSSMGTTTHTQQGFNSIGQPNPFGTTPDPNFNQFGNSAPINGTTPTNNGAWANFNQHPQNTKLQWMTSNGTANPFMATPQMPSSGSSYNPFL